MSELPRYHIRVAKLKWALIWQEGPEIRQEGPGGAHEGSGLTERSRSDDKTDSKRKWQAKRGLGVREENIKKEDQKLYQRAFVSYMKP